MIRMWHELSHSNGRRRTQPPPERNSALRHTGRWWRRYLLAVASASTSAGAIAVVDLTLSFPPFVLFVAAVGFTWLFAGSGPAVCALVLSTLASDYFFVEPRYELSLNGTVFWLAAVYSTGAVVSRVVAVRAAGRTQTKR